MVAGHLDGQESFRQALIREAKEEANIDLEFDDLDIVHVIHRQENYTDVGKRERLDVFIKPRKWKGKIKNLESHKCDDISWFPIDNIPNNTIPFIKEVIKNIQDKVFYSEIGF